MKPTSNSEGSSRTSHVGFHTADGSEIRQAPVDMVHTPLKINMEPKNEGLEDDVPFLLGHFQVPC